MLLINPNTRAELFHVLSHHAAEQPVVQPAGANDTCMNTVRYCSGVQNSCPEEQCDAAWHSHIMVKLLLMAALLMVFQSVTSLSYIS